MADSNPVFPPGLKPTYSNVGFNLLGFVIEKETGMTYEAAVKKYITQPLGMSRTGFLPARTNAVIPTVGLWHADLGQNNPYPSRPRSFSPLTFQCRGCVRNRLGPLPPRTVNPHPNLPPPPSRHPPQLAKTRCLRHLVVNPSRRIPLGNHSHHQTLPQWCDRHFH